MPQTVNVNFRLDETTKKTLEEVCSEMGITMSTDFTIFAVKVAKERRIPFEITANPFYSSSNIEFLKRGIKAFENRKVQEHDIIE